MTPYFWSQLVLLLIVAASCGAFGFILGSLCATSAIADAGDPLLPREFEHECDAPYPRIGD